MPLCLTTATALRAYVQQYVALRDATLLLLLLLHHFTNTRRTRTRTTAEIFNKMANPKQRMALVSQRSRSSSCFLSQR